MSSAVKYPVLLAILFVSISFAQEIKRPKILGISHIALFVHNLDSSFVFYKDLLGYQEPFRLNKPDGTFSTAFIKVNDLQAIELFPEKETGSDRLYQVAFFTDDAAGMRNYLESRGVKVPPNVNKGRIGNYNFSFKDPNGFTVEMVQYEKEGWTLKDSGLHMSASRISDHIRHIGFIVDTLKSSLSFYRDILGFEETWRGSKDGASLSWVNLKVPDGTDYIEFMLYKENERPKSRLGSMNHMSLEVENLDEAVAKLESNTVRKLYKRKIEITTGINRKRQCNLYDPDGTRAELMEPKTVDGVTPPSSKAHPPK